MGSRVGEQWIVDPRQSAVNVRPTRENVTFIEGDVKLSTSPELLTKEHVSVIFSRQMLPSRATSSYYHRSWSRSNVTNQTTRVRRNSRWNRLILWKTDPYNFRRWIFCRRNEYLAVFRAVAWLHTFLFSLQSDSWIGERVWLCCLHGYGQWRAPFRFRVSPWTLRKVISDTFTFVQCCIRW